MDTMTFIEDGFAFARSRLDGVGDASLDGATPCERWDLRHLVNHMVNAAGTAADVLAGTDDTDPWTRTEEELSETDCGWPEPLVKFDWAIDTIVTACRDGALERPYFLHQAQMPGSVLARSAVFDSVIHGWDIARATGQDAEIPVPIAEELLAFAADIPDAARGRAFSDKVEVDGGASPSDRLVALLGRAPAQSVGGNGR